MILYQYLTTIITQFIRYNKAIIPISFRTSVPVVSLTLFSMTYLQSNCVNTRKPEGPLLLKSVCPLNNSRLMGTDRFTSCAEPGTSAGVSSPGCGAAGILAAAGLFTGCEQPAHNRLFQSLRTKLAEMPSVWRHFPVIPTLLRFDLIKNRQEYRNFSYIICRKNKKMDKYRRPTP